MRRQDLVKKLATAESQMEKLVEERKSLRETILALKMIIDMSDAGQLDIFEKSTTTK